MACDFGFKPTKNKVYYFISYNSLDVDRISMICREMDKRNVPMWYDNGLESGKKWEKTLIEKIRDCYEVILFITENLLNREDAYVIKEYKYAKLFGKRVNIIILDNITDNIGCEKMNKWFKHLNIKDNHFVPICANSSTSQTVDSMDSIFVRIFYKIKRRKLCKRVLFVSVVMIGLVVLCVSTRDKISDLFSDYDNPEIYQYSIYDDGVVIDKLIDNNSTVLKIPKRINGRIVTKIGEGAFNNCKNLNSVSIPDTVTVIGKKAFAGCTGLTEIRLPNSVGYVGAYAFSECDNLRKVYLPETINRIWNYSFWRCCGLEEITIPSTVTEIGKCAFSQCYKLKTVYFPDNLQIINERSFENCVELEKISLPESVTEIGEQAFRNCRKITSIEIPDGVTEISPYLFDGCCEIRLVKLPNNVTVIREAAFADCSELSEMQLPESVFLISNYAFWSCSNLTSINLPNSVSFIGENAFGECDNLIVICSPFSYSEIYVKEHGIKYKYK